VAFAIEKNTLTHNTKLYSHTCRRFILYVRGVKNSRRHVSSNINVTINVTVNEGIAQLGVIAIDSITSELKQMCDKNVWEGVTYESLTSKQKRTIISSSMFLKEKYTADGMFEKLKSRLVAGRHLQDRGTYSY
jgi:hypothetical protein